MKKLFTLLLIATAFGISNDASAQRSKKNNIAAQPLWGPTGFNYAEYYFIPDFDIYYHVPAKKFIYLHNDSVWVFDTVLPLAYSNADLFSSYKVVLNKKNAYLDFKEHQQLYLHLKGNRSQPVIRDSEDPKYFVVKGHAKYQEPVEKPKKPKKKSKKAAPKKKAKGQQ